MKVKIEYNEKVYQINPDEGIDISISVKFNENKNPKFYDMSPPQKKYYKYNDIEYNVDKGAGCNVPLINMNIHCCGTHTETSNHISKNGPYISEIPDINHMPSQLISIEPRLCLDENYHTKINEDDKVITKEQIKQKVEPNNNFQLKSLIIRTLPNDNDKITKNYNDENHPFLSNNAISYIKEIGIKHLLIDTPSIDKYEDDGKLGNHKIFFLDKQGTPNNNTITELVFIPNNCKDGNYFLNLGIPKFNLDAAPTRPIIFPIEK